jgi:hypothetical protein
MKLVIVGPGIMPIPPVGWGAVEILIWDYKCFIEKIYGNDVNLHIINTPNLSEIISATNNLQPDIVHIHYDVFWNIVDYLQCKNVILTSHYGYIESSNWFGGYYPIFDGFINSRAYIHCLSDRVQKIYENKGVSKERLFTIPNGANQDLFTFSETPRLLHKSIYLGKIEPRKRQSIYQYIENIDFVGEIHDNSFNRNNGNYKGVWTKDNVYNKLTHYANLILLSDGEVHPLVVCEALMCGLGVVVSEAASANLDRTKEFIHVIPNDKLDDLIYVKNIIELNKQIVSQPYIRIEIRNYGLQYFSYTNIITNYINKLKSICVNDLNNI